MKNMLDDFATMIYELEACTKFCPFFEHNCFNLSDGCPCDDIDKLKKALRKYYESV